MSGCCFERYVDWQAEGSTAQPAPLRKRWPAAMPPSAIGDAAPFLQSALPMVAQASGVCIYT